MLYIRHAEKAYRNGHANQATHDPPLTIQGLDDIPLVAKVLLSKYGMPSRIVSSPYQRTRQTAKVIADLFDMKYEIDINLGEYISGKRKVDVVQALTTETATLNPVVNERYTSFDERVKQHMEGRMVGTWYITHGTIIRHLAKLEGTHISKVPYLGTYSSKE